ncbi:MAG: hypothetical protein AB8B64_01105 [Granulosicoccus sp.]
MTPLKIREIVIVFHDVGLEVRSIVTPAGESCHWLPGVGVALSRNNA